MTVQDDLVLVDGERHAARDAAQGALELFVAKRSDVPAGVAHEMIVMAGAVPDGLIARHALADVQAADQPQPLELVKHPVHAGARHATLTPPERVLDLRRRQCARLRGEQLDDGTARATATIPGSSQAFGGHASPVMGISLSHPPHGSRRGSRSGGLQRAVAVAVLLVGVVQLTVDEKVDVIAMRNRFMTAIGPVAVLVAVTVGGFGVPVGMRLADGDDVLVDVVVVGVMQMPVVQIVDVIFVADRGVPTIEPVNVGVILMNVMSHADHRTGAAIPPPS